MLYGLPGLSHLTATILRVQTVAVPEHVRALAAIQAIFAEPNWLNMPIAKVHVGRKFSVNSCFPDFPLIKGAAFYGEIRKTGIYEMKYNQTCTFPIGIWLNLV
jgi:hypothetical protein